MSKELFARPDLEQYKRQAKELLRGVKAGKAEALKRFQESHPKCSASVDADSLKLHDAQWVLAREHGFPSWRAMQVQIAALNAVGDSDAFLRAAVWIGAEGNFEKAREMLTLRPALAGVDLYCACVTGDFDTAERLLKAEPGLAVRKGGAKQWEPILYVCFSAFLEQQSRRGQGERFVAIVRLLLELGADPNTAFTGKEEWGNPRETALYGASGVANHAGVTELLLKAGADPSDGNPTDRGGETVYHTAEFRDLACMKLLFAYGVSQPAKDYCLCRQLDFENPEGTRLFLENGANPNVMHGPLGTTLHHAILRDRSREVISLILEYGADVNAADSKGMTPYRMASRFGRTEVASLLAEHGAEPDLTPVDRFLSACASGEPEAVERCVLENPGVVAELSDEDRKVLAVAARENRVPMAKALLDAGLDLSVEDGGHSPMHWAAWFGYPEVIELFLRYGPDLEARNRYGGTPLSVAIYASRHCQESNSLEKKREREANYIRVANLLIAAGAEVHEWMLGLGTAALDKLVERALARRKASG